MAVTKSGGGIRVTDLRSIVQCNTGGCGVWCVEAGGLVRACTVGCTEAESLGRQD